jgi:HSP20 family protein
MNTLTEQVKQGAEQAWESLAEGWRALRTRASGALTRFRRNDGAAPGEFASSVDRFESAGWGLMAADIRQDDDRVVVRIEAPGMSREDLHIDVDRDRLCVWGEKRVDSESRDGDYHLVQCAYGSFRRDLMLPQSVDADRATASYRDGVLRIEIPRLDRDRGRRIVVQGD